MKVCPKSACISTVGVRKDLFARNPDEVPITDFFGSVRPVKLLEAIPVIEDLKYKVKQEEKVADTDGKPKKYRYIPPLPTFSSKM